MSCASRTSTSRSSSDDDVLVRVRAASVNPLDWHLLRGHPVHRSRRRPGWRKPKRNIPGVDVAGPVEAVGRNVTRFKPGDEVFGEKSRACAEYVSGAEKHASCRKPANLTFERGGGRPGRRACTALQALRDKGEVQPGQKVLINGASGGVGTFAVQIAKAFGADVTGVCSTPNVDLVRSLGADHVIDYTREDFTRTGRRYDLIIDNVGNRSLLACRRVLAPTGTLVVVGAPKGTGSATDRHAILAASCCRGSAAGSSLAPPDGHDAGGPGRPDGAHRSRHGHARSSTGATR